ncbi:Ig-like domain-containing protein [Pseudoalteromonas sp. SSDWG2]|uniref:Ig-like domain-containing protein n=1 Tax=Pseudoalteromonas sp. SSDWG2 TaxID=3139391 RepID=UPI003BAA32DB
MGHFNPSKAAVMLMPLSLSALPALAGAYSGYIRTPAPRSHLQQVQSITDVGNKPTLTLTSDNQSSSPTLTQGQVTQTPSGAESSLLELTQGTFSAEILVIDANLKDKAVFYKALNRNLHIIELDEHTPVLEQLNSKLAHYPHISALHWVSHGRQGQINIGNQHLDKNTLTQQLSQLETLGNKLTTDADIRFYNCDLGKGEAGAEFIELFAANTGADIAASNNLTGNPSQGGDWELEVTQGNIDSTSPFSDIALRDFSDVLGAYIAADFCNYTKNDFGECGQTETSPDGNIAATASAEFLQYFVTTNPQLLSGSATPGPTANISFAKSGSYENFTLDSVQIEVEGSCDLSITNNSGQTISSSATLTDGVYNLTISGNNVNISSFTVQGANCSVNSTYFGIIGFSVSPYNDAPVINNLDGDVVGAYPTAPPLLLDQGTVATLTDGDSTDFNAGQLVATVSSGAVASDDILSVDQSGAVTLSGTTAGSNVLVSTNIIGTLGNNVTAGNDFVVNFNASATPTRVETLLRALTYQNIDNDFSSANQRTVRVTVSDGDGATSANQDITVNILSPNHDGSLSAATIIRGPGALLDSTADTVGEAFESLRMLISDGGGGDGLAMNITAMNVHVTGSITEAERNKITWLLNGNDVTNVVGTYNAGTITFGGLNIAIDDGTTETYSVYAYFNDNTGLTEWHNFALSTDGDTDVTTALGTTMSSTTPASSDTAHINVEATRLTYLTQPAGSISGIALSTQPVVAATDDFDNVDTDINETFTLTENSAGTLTNATATANNGVATFSSLTYSASSDNEMFILTADDQNAVGSDLPSRDANSVTSDVVATQLRFDVQPTPTSMNAGEPVNFTTVPVVQAVDASLILDVDYQTVDIILSEANGAGTAQLSGTGDQDANAASVSLTPSAGVVTFNGLAINYTLAGISTETFNLRANSGALSAADSSQLTALADTTAPSVTGVSSSTANGTYTLNEVITVTVTFDEVVNVFGGNPQLALETGATDQVASYFAGSGTQTLTFNYQVQSGDNSADLAYASTAALVANGATITDAAGNNANLTLPSVGGAGSLSGNKDLVIDALAPSLPVVTSPVSATTVTTTDTSIAGTHDEDGVTIALLADANNDGIADNSTALTSTTVAANSWSVTANLVLGTNEFVVSAVDSVGNRSSDVGVATITREEPNQAPTISGTPATSVTSSQAYSFVPTASDPDGDVLTFSITNKPTWASFDTTTGALSGTPTLNDVGSYSAVQISVSDGALSAQLAPFSIEVVAENQAPTISGTPATSVTSSQAYSFVPTASDPDGDVLTFSITNKPTWASFDTTTGALSGTPTLNDVGSYSAIQITVSDGALSAQLASFSIEVVAENQAPTISGTPATSVTSSQAYSFVPTASDPDGDVLTFSITNKPTWASFDTTTGALSGTPTLNDVGSYSAIQITVSDGALSAQLASFSIEVVAENQAPTISGTPATSVTSSQAYSFVPTASDPDGDVLTFSITNKPTWASFDTTTGALAGTPTLNDVGSYSAIHITVSDGALSAQLAPFNIEVIAENQAPVINSQSLQTQEDTSASLQLDITDETPQNIEVSISVAAQNGSAQIVGMQLNYTPNDNFNGADSVTLVASDGELQSEAKVINIKVQGINDAPVANDDTFVLSRNDTNSYELNVINNDTDADADDALTITTASSQIGELAIVNNNLVYSPPAGLDEVMQIHYRIEDGSKEADTAIVSVSFTGDLPSDTPTLVVPADIEVNASGLFTKVNLGFATAMDVDGKAIPVRLLNNPIYFPSGEHKVYWQASDDQGRTMTKSQRVVIHPMVSLAPNSITTEGTQHSIDAYLSGPAPSYPVIVPFTVSGSADASDHSLNDAQLVFNSEHTLITVDVFADATAEADEFITIALDTQSNLGAQGQHTVTITEQNIAPTVSISARQNSQPMALYVVDAQIQLNAQVDDANPNDSHTYLWTVEPNVDITNATSANASIDANILSEGQYAVTATVVDNGLPALTNTAQISLDVRTALPPLGDGDSDGDLIPDEDEGYIDLDGDGMPDYLDAQTNCSIMSAMPTQQSSFFVNGQHGTCLHRSPFADGENGGAIIDFSKLPVDPQSKRAGSIFAMILTGLPEAGDSATIVLPLTHPTPANAFYRKFLQVQWQDFVTDDNNHIKSAKGSRGYCPAIGSEQWQPGIGVGHWCLMLTIEDGGANDGDGLRNNAIVDPGVVAIAANDNSAPMAQGDVYTVIQSSNSLLDVLANDTDADNDALTIISVESIFDVAQIQDDKVMYSAPANYLGSDTLMYVIQDEFGYTNSAIVEVNVVTNQPPSAMDDSASTAYGLPVVINVLNNDSDPEGGTLSVTSASSEQGSVQINNDHTLSYTPLSGFSGDAYIDYTISDEFGSTASARVHIMVAAKVTSENKSSGGSLTLGWLLCWIIMARLTRPWRFNTHSW